MLPEVDAGSLVQPPMRPAPSCAWQAADLPPRAQRWASGGVGGLPGGPSPICV